MYDPEQAFHLATEASVTLRKLADHLRSGYDPSDVADQAESDAATLQAAVAAARL